GHLPRLLLLQTAAIAAGLRGGADGPAYRAAPPESHPAAVTPHAVASGVLQRNRPWTPCRWCSGYRGVMLNGRPHVHFAADPGTGKSGLYADTLNVTFDDFQAFATDARNPLVPRIVGTAQASLSGGTLLIEGKQKQGGRAEVDRFQDDDYR
ncbi:MAG TPA: hypothetical protein PKK06_17760, partial [Phycisphaerae bacterium]|nr:hypothetical protein [Phycisphaerae bacterium]